MRTFRAADAAVVYAHPAPQLRRLEQLGVLHRLAHGYYTVVPQDQIGTNWMPTLEGAAAGIAAARFHPDRAPLMGVSAARLHGALPRALAVAIVAAPAQHDPITLLDRPASVRFVKRDMTRVDVETVPTELGRALVTSIEQTVLDLARRPALNVAEDQIPDALRALLPRCEPEVLDELARRQRLRSALARARDLAR
jgi:transcriptional regulator with AbiEi antitoxin domain of type IV toxin-antitoxin system